MFTSSEEHCSSSFCFLCLETHSHVTKTEDLALCGSGPQSLCSLLTRGEQKGRSCASCISSFANDNGHVDCDFKSLSRNFLRVWGLFENECFKIGTVVHSCRGRKKYQFRAILDHIVSLSQKMKKK